MRQFVNDPERSPLPHLSLDKFTGGLRHSGHSSHSNIVFLRVIMMAMTVVTAPVTLVVLTTINEYLFRCYYKQTLFNDLAKSVSTVVY